MENNDYHNFMERLKKAPVTSQQYHTLRGQAICGDVQAAEKGLNKIIERRYKGE